MPRSAGSLKSKPPRPTLCVRLPVLSMLPEQAPAYAPVEPWQRVSSGYLDWQRKVVYNVPYWPHGRLYETLDAIDCR
jgi:hypothetical protein